jgi:hypothetical protein
MDAALAGLLGTAVGAAAGIVGTALSVRHQRLLEAERARTAQEGELLRLEREALLDLAKRFAAALNTVLYLTWYAWKIPERVTAQALVDYEETMKELLGSLLGSHIGASSMSGRAFATIDPLIQQLYELDERIALEIGHYDDEPDDARNRIGSLHEAARRLERQSVDDLRSMLQLRFRPEPDQHAPGVTRAAPE